MPKLSNLRRIREGKFLSQQELGTKAGVSRATIIRLESGGIAATFQTTRRLAEALGVAPEELVGQTEKAAPYDMGSLSAS